MAGFISGSHFYHATTRKVVAVFGSLFNDIRIVRRDSGGNTLNIEKVPLAYGPAQKFLSRIEEQADLTDPRLAIKLPRIAFEMTSMTYDPAAKVSRFNQDMIHNNDGSVSVARPYVPYVLTFEVNVLAKAQDDGLQIIEQILPTFHPEYNVSVKWTSNDTADMPITLDGVSLSDDYESDYISRRVLMYTLTFSVKARYYGEITDGGSIITRADIDFWDMTTDTNEFLQAYGVRVDPFGAGFNDEWTEFEYHLTVPSSYTFKLVLTNVVGEFDNLEPIRGTELNSAGTIIAGAIKSIGTNELGQTELLISPSNGYWRPSYYDEDDVLQPGDTITGQISGATATIDSVDDIISDEP